MKCKVCGEKMFKDSMGGWICPKCDLNDSTYDIIYNHIVPEGCRQCGGDYPNCISGCPLMDN